MPLTIFDIIILTIISISSLQGLYKGMLQVVISSLCFIATIFVTIWIYPKVQVIFVSYFDNELIISIISGISSYIFSLLVFTFIASSLKVMTSPISQGFLDRFLGLFAGFIRGALISLVLFSIAAFYVTGSYSRSFSIKEEVCKLPLENYPEWLKKSITTSPLESLLKGIINIMPEGFLNMIDLIDYKKAKEKAGELILPNESQ